MRRHSLIGSIVLLAAGALALFTLIVMFLEAV